LNAKAAAIEDEAIRSAFLAIPDHARTVALADRLLGGDIPLQEGRG
jgi:hypothetical protein